MTVLIPSAGLGSRLKPQTNFFNKTMISIDNLPAISHIINSYDIKTDFIIALGYQGKHLKEYLQYYHTKNKFKFINIQNYSGPGSSLNTTLRRCSKEIKSDFIFHVNDAIIKQKISQNFDNDTLLISNKYSKSNYFRKISINKKKIDNIYSKNYKPKKKIVYSYIGVAYIKDYISFNKIINNNNNNDLGELNYFEISCSNNTLDYKKISNWYDTGNHHTLNDTVRELSKFQNLSKLDESIYFKSNRVIKFYVNKPLVKKRVIRAKILNKCVPKILSSSKYFYSYNYVKGVVFANSNPNLYDFKKLMIFLKKNLWLSTDYKLKNTFKKQCENFYYHKTKLRIKSFYQIYKISDNENIINGKKYPKLINLISLIDWKVINDGIPVLFHGDLHFENIIKTKKSFKLIDWRDSFDKNLKVGDIYYDFAKLYHGLLVKHSFVKNNDFYIFLKNKSIKIHIKKFKGYEKIIKFFLQYIKKSNYSLYKLNIITALIFLNISPLHSGRYGIFLYYLGKKMLGDTINNYKNEKII